MRKYLFFISFFVCFLGNAQDLSKVRNQYPKAVESSEITSKLNEELSKIDASSKPVFKAYKGAILTLMAKYAKGRKHKKQFFKEGVSLIESAIEAAPKNTEIHYIRMTVQENSPRFLGYHKNIDTDKQFILNSYSKIPSKELKSVIKDFVLNSENFSETDKKLF
jgi:hypothetical protein